MNNNNALPFTPASFNLFGLFFIVIATLMFCFYFSMIIASLTVFLLVPRLIIVVTALCKILFFVIFELFLNKRLYTLLQLGVIVTFVKFVSLVVFCSQLK